ncbi:hypothetical protein OSB04_002046 [Centaurea solstitialis]|uniref:RING-type domain-containing protein n=1 Tax=Centaurea solstitialis TaxID=347529 RepID=A0AA38U3W1_9ASTR|nr:hypothetical protein OSB04_002046 [Centaurea solstitialis]
MEGRTLCEAHFLQGRHRQHKEPVPDDLKLERTKRSRRTQQIEENPNGNLEIRANGNVVVLFTQKRGKRKSLVDGENPENPSENLEIRANGKRGKRSHKEDDDSLKKMKLKKGDLKLDLIRGYLNREIEKKKGKQPQKGDIVKELKYGRLEISQSSPSTTTPITTSVNNGGLLNVKVGIPASNSMPTRFFRSKNVDRLPIATMQILPSIKANVKATTKKCHWCRMCSYRVLVKCLTCKKQFFCEDCIHERHLDKAEIKKQCPVCHGNCSCRVCIRGRSKEVKTKELVYNGDEKFDKRQQLLYMLYLLLPLLEQINEEKTIELEIEANIKGKEDSEVEIPCATSSQKRQCCSFCKACIVDVYRSCGNCSYVLCLSCCREFRDGDLHGGLKNLKYTKNDKRKSSLCTILRDWNTNEDGSIKCPPKNLGGCGDGVLGLFRHPPVNRSKDLEESAKEIVSASNIAECFEADSSGCALCDDEPSHREGKNVDGILINDKGLYFPIREDLGDENLRHFVKHWVKGQPLIIRDVIKSETELSWDPVFMFCTYLEQSAKSRKDKEVKLKNCSDWCEVQMGRQQIFMGGKTHANVWDEKLKFKVWLSSGFFQEHFPSHYVAAINALPLQEYINPLTGILNLAANVPPESQNLDLGPFVYISYGRAEDLMRSDFLTKLCYHAYDMVNILVHATDLPISEKKLNKVKILLNKYSSQDQNESLEKNETNQPCGRSSFSSEVTQQSEELEEDNTKGELTQIPNGKNQSAFSDDSSLSESDDEDLCQDESGSSSCNKGKPVDTSGAQWDVFEEKMCQSLWSILESMPMSLTNRIALPKRYHIPINVKYLGGVWDCLFKTTYAYLHICLFAYCWLEKLRVVHPILDENFYLDAFHMKYLKDEFDVEPWTFEQRIGEAVIIPAGCPYQVKKVKVKKMTIHSVNAAVEEIRAVSQAEYESILFTKS